MMKILLLARHALQVLLNKSSSSCGPGLDLIVAPRRQVVHVLKQLLPSHHTRSGVRSDEVRATTAQWVCSELLAHVLAKACELVLHLCTHHCVGLLAGLHLHKSTSLRMPALDCVCTPVDQIVHVLQELIPGHDTWSGIRWGEARARALGVSTDLLAHVLADSCNLVLDGGTMNQGLLLARHALQLLLNQSTSSCGPGFDLPVAPLREVVHVLEELLPGHHSWSRIRSDEIWAATAQWVCSKLLAHVLAKARKLVLHLGADFNLVLLARLHLHKSTGLRMPALDGVCTPVDQIVHVLQELIPGHDTRSGIRWGEAGARTLGVGANLLAHVLADSCKPVLDRGTMMKILLLARHALQVLLNKSS